MIPSEFVFVDSMPLTASGKIDRRALPGPGEAAGEERVSRAPRNPAESLLAEIWADVLRVERVGIDDNFFELGGDSILSILVIARANQAGLPLDTRLFFAHQTIAELAPALSEAAPLESQQGPVTGEVPLTPVQHWFFEQQPEAPHHFNQAVLLEVSPQLAAGQVEEALAQLLALHDALRLRFVQRDGEWRQHYGPIQPVPLQRLDLALLKASRQADALERAAGQLQGGLDLQNGPLMRAALFEMGRGEAARLLLIIHHLAVDGVSWRILLGDLESACRQLLGGQQAELSPKTASYRLWAERLQEYAASEELDEESEYWLGGEVRPLPLDFENAQAAAASSESLSFSLSQEETLALLQEVPGAYRTQINDVLLAALSDALSGWAGQGPLLVDLEGHGREDLFEGVDLTRTVGWFTSIHPLLLGDAKGASAAKLLKSVKELLRNVPRKGIGYGVLRYLSPQDGLRQRLEALPPAQVNFNYLGQLDQALPRDSLFRPAGEGTGLPVSPRARRRYALEVTGRIRQGRLRMSCSYSPHLHRRSSIECFIEGYSTALRRLIEHCCSEGAGGCTPSDFPLAGLGQADLDRLLEGRSQVEDLYPLSPMQQGMLPQSLYQPHEYVVQNTCRLEGKLQAEHFKQAWRQVIERQPILRTAFLWEGLGEPLQLVQRRAGPHWEEADWRQLSVQEQREKLADLLADDCNAEIDLTRAPLMRFHLIRLDEQVHQFTWTVHHLLLDGWSSPRVLRQVVAAYHGLCSGRPPAQEPLAPFREFISWLGRQDPARSESFWRRYLAGFTEATPLAVADGSPADFADGPSAGPLECKTALPEEVTADLEALARRRHLTINTFLQGAWALLLHRYSGCREVLFGVTVSGRPGDLPGVESMVGLFINTIPLRMPVTDSEPLLAWLPQLQERHFKGDQSGHVPLSQIQKWSEVPAGRPLFESLLVFENYPSAETPQGANIASETGLRVRQVRAAEQAHFPVTLLAAPGDCLSLMLRCQAGRLAPDAARRMLRHFKALLEAMVTVPESRIGELPWLSRAERHQLLQEWSGTTAGYPRHSSIQQLFGQQAKARPDRVALAGGEVQLSYAELDRRSECLALYLQQLGAGPEMPLGLCLERSAELITAMLGILKAGSSYLPLDPSYPLERLSFMLEDSGAALVLTQQSLSGSLPSYGVWSIALDQEWALIEQSEGALGEPFFHPCQPAYIMYTSGSTGRPKGVSIPHRAVVRLVRNTNFARLDGAQTLLLLAPISFDASTFEIWGALLNGARLALFPAQDPTLDELSAQIEGQGVTTLWLTAPLFHLMADQMPQALGRLDQLLAGGDVLFPALVKRALRAGTGRLINGYGPTEGTTFSCCFPVNGEADGQRSVPIGPPIANSSAWVLDSGFKPLPQGVAGELFIGGDGLARGYLNSPALTAQRFVPHPFERGQRLYRSGDRVRWRRDGVLEFLGRLDRQVKIRGFRIEPGELESVLNSHPSVGQCAVMVLAAEDGGKRLVAYVSGRNQEAGIRNQEEGERTVRGSQFAVGSPETEPGTRKLEPGTTPFFRSPSAPPSLQPQTLRSFLQQRLPGYMIPSEFVLLDSFPLTPSGKIDRGALPEPDGAEGQQDRYRAPRTPSEALLAEIWAEVLRVERVGIDDNFFELGGDSILIIQAISRANRAGLNLSTKLFFENQSIARLAPLAGLAEAPLQAQGPVSGEVPLTPVQHWFFEHHQADPHHFNQAVLLEVEERLDAGLLDQAVRRLLSEHDALRLRFSRQGSEWRQFYAAAGESGRACCELDLSALRQPRRAGALEAAAGQLQASLQLEEGPLMRTAFFKLADGQAGRLLVIIHHLAVDGVSWRILLEDLEAACRQLLDGRPARLPRRTTSYQRWSQRLGEYASTEELTRQSDYWLDGLAEAACDLPLDFPEGENSNEAAASAGFRLSRQETQSLLQEVHRAYRTRINDILLASLAQSLSGWAGEGPMLIDLEGHGREDLFEGLDLSRTVGWFTSIFPVALQAAAEPDPAGLIKAVKELLRNVPGRGIGYGVLRYLTPDATLQERLRALPQARISFNYLGQLDQALPRQSLFRPAAEGTGESVSRRGQRRYLLDVHGRIRQGRLRIEWAYSRNLHRPATIEALAARHAEALRGLIRHCLSEEAGGYTPSDFDLAGLGQSQIDQLLGGWRDVEDVYPATPLQQGLLFHSLYAENRGEYVVQASWRMDSRLQVAAFKRAWLLAWRRHAILRTAFLWEGLGEPLQVVRSGNPPAWREEDWSRLSAPRQQERLDGLFSADREEGFEPARAPLMRLSLIRLGGESHQFFWSFHHLLLDGWSVALLLRDVFSLYEALAQGLEPPPQESPPCRSYIAWLRQQDRSQAEAFWRQALSGFASPTPLGRDFSEQHEAARPSGHQTLEHSLSEAATLKLDSLARRCRLTVNNLLQAAWSVLLSRGSGRQDVLFGIVVSGRPPELEGVETMIGLFINTLPLRVRVSPDQGLTAWLQELQQLQARMQQFQYLPLSEVQKWSQAPAGLPLFESLMAFENYPVDESLRESGRSAGGSGMRFSDRTHYPLTVTAVPGPRLSIRMGHGGNRFEEVTIRRKLRQLEALLLSIASGGEQPLWQLSLLDEREKIQILSEWNDKRAEYPEDCGMAQLFEEQARRRPDALALAYGEVGLSYAELDRRAAQAARNLRASIPACGARVAVLLEPSPEMVAVIVGVLKAGAAYVPLDPGYPSRRLAFMLQDSRAAAIVLAGGQGRLSGEGIPSFDPQRLLALDATAPARPDPARHCGAGSLACLIYTSGSTGRPKGVAVPQRAVNRLVFHAGYLDPGPADCIAQASNPSFDAATFEIWGALLKGGRLTGLPRQTALSPLQLQDFLKRRQINTLFLTTALFNQVARLAPAAFEPLDQLLFGGEAVDPGAVRRILQADPPRRLLHVYGPTENCTFSTWQRVWEVAAGAGTVPIGGSISNTLSYVLDGCLEALPAGMAGELCLGGDGLAWGYLGRPSRTAPSFVPDPFSGHAGARLYRTGDLVRWNLQGSLEFLGRFDRQVKVRGFRVEPGEIEAALSRHPEVGEAVVTLREDVPGEKRLVAYLSRRRQEAGGRRQEEGEAASVRSSQFTVGSSETEPGTSASETYSLQPTAYSLSERESGPEPGTRNLKPDPLVRGSQLAVGSSEGGTGKSLGSKAQSPRSSLPLTLEPAAYSLQPTAFSSSLRSFLKQSLPEYMIPAVFVELEEFPLTPNGKIDRRALPAPEGARQEQETAFEAPRNAAQAQLVRIWQEVLRVEPVGIHDNFFELGGDSILSIQIVARAAQAGIQLRTGQIFEHPTIAELALRAGIGAQIEAQQGLVEGEVPLTPIQRWFFGQDPVQPHHYNQALLLEVDADLDLGLLEEALLQLPRQHDALRLRFAPSPQGWRQWIAAGEEGAAVCRLDLSRLDEPRRTGALQEAAGLLQSSLNLQHGPLMRAALFDMQPAGPGRLLVTVHHLAVDGVSWRILLQDLEALCHQMSQGLPFQLPSKTSSFKAWAQRLLDYAGQIDGQEADYWLDSSRSRSVALPVDFEGGENASRTARSVSVWLDRDQTQRLLQQVPQAYRTQINEVLLAALAQSLSRWAGPGPLLVDLEGHGREELFEEIDLSRTVGWFTTLFPVLLEVEEAEDPAGSLKAVKEQLRAVPGRGLGYGVLRRLQPGSATARRLEEQHQAQLSFNYLGQLDQALPDSPYFRLASESSGPAGSPLARRDYLLEVNSSIRGGRLRVVWTYSPAIHRSSSIEGLAEHYLEALGKLIEHCCRPDAGGCTPSDFPLARLSQQQLDQLLGDARNVEDLYPAAPLQAGMLFHTLSQPEKGEYLVQTSCRLARPLDVNAFRNAWQETALRQPVLRSAFLWEGLPEPLQVVRSGVELDWQAQDWSGLSPQQREERFQALLDRERRQGFQLGQAPLMRLRLIDWDEQSYRFLWSYHHILMDGWSVPLLLQEFFGLYEALRRGGEEPPRKPRRSYRDYIAWLQAQSPGQAEAFWRRYLAGFERPTPLGIDRPAAPQDGGEGAYSEVQIHLSEPEAQALQSLGRRQGLTLNTLVQGAWALLLSRYSGRRDVLFGAVTAGRPADLEGVESMIGLFINTLPLRARIQAGQASLGWLRGLQKEQLEARRFEYSPLLQVQKWSGLPGGRPLFESIVVFENYPVDRSLRESGLSLGIGDVRSVEWTNYPLSLTAIPTAGLSLSLSFEKRRFSAPAIARMLGHLQCLLSGLASRPEGPADDLPLLSEAERFQLLREWNPSGPPPRQAAGTIPELFEEQSGRHPEAVAVEFRQEFLSYGELQRRSAQLADHLRGLGARLEVPVAICMGRCPEMIISVLGVLRAGSPYLPLDPSNPAERNVFLLQDSRAKLVLTMPDSLGALPDGGPPTVCVGRDWPVGQAGSRPSPARIFQHNAAYLIYTSGSTGIPKGVVVEHRSLCRYIQALKEQYGCGPGDRLLQFHSFSFDASVDEIFVTLLNGAALVLRSPEMLDSIAGFLLRCRALALTVLDFPTAMWHQVASELGQPGTPGLPPAVRLVIFGGERALARQLSLWQRHGGAKARLVHGYGVTEATIGTTFGTPPRLGGDPFQEVPIGRPASNSCLYLLDSCLRPVPIGVAGELVIGGQGLARGYLERPARSASSFVPDPFSRQPGARLYRTGDLACYRPDGQVEFIGRIDDQVKVRGFRVEPGEVGAVLARHPQVSQAAVIARRDGQGGNRLIAYLVPKPGAGFGTGHARLREFLQQSLPEYMLPSAFVELDALPLTAQEKLDRRALPEPEAEQMSALAAPRNAAEASLAEIWQEVLGLERVGVDDNFFELGGDSILSIQIVA
ncbi:MAG: non-ribosomal peptide synthase/polyketide synthase, partial [Acidobacteriota bacterium]